MFQKIEMENEGDLKIKISDIIDKKEALGSLLDQMWKSEGGNFLERVLDLE